MHSRSARASTSSFQDLSVHYFCIEAQRVIFYSLYNSMSSYFNETNKVQMCTLLLEVATRKCRKKIEIGQRKHAPLSRSTAVSRHIEHRGGPTTHAKESDNEIVQPVAIVVLQVVQRCCTYYHPTTNSADGVVIRIPYMVKACKRIAAPITSE